MILIDSDRLKKELAHMWYNSQLSITGISVSELIDEQPTVDAVPVIRCKDCKYNIWSESIDDWYCSESGLVRFRHANDFCSRAKRREDEAPIIPTEIIDSVLGEDE